MLRPCLAGLRRVVTNSWNAANSALAASSGCRGGCAASPAAPPPPDVREPAGIETYGNTSYTITDSQGDPQVIFFSRPTPIYIWVTCALTLYPEETFPPNGTSLVAAAINSYGNSLGIGVDVLFQRVLAQIFTVSGIASGNMSIAATFDLVTSPTYGTSDIIIAENQISIFDLSRIFITVV